MVFFSFLTSGEFRIGFESRDLNKKGFWAETQKDKTFVFNFSSVAATQASVATDSTSTGFTFISIPKMDFLYDCKLKSFNY